MDKQMIEEMAKDIVRSAGLGVYEKTEYLYDLGYRKIPEGAVVLTREEYSKLKGRAEEVFNEMTERMKAEVKIERKMGNRKVEQTRKETAEKFERLANERIAKEQGERDGYDTYRIDNKAKYDGDIVSFVLFEICKEITEGKE